MSSPTAPPVLGPRPRGPPRVTCHPARGGRKNAPVAGLPASSFIRQREDFRRSARVSADPRTPATPTTGVLAKAMTDEEISAAAEHFGAMNWTPWTRGIETAPVPRTRIAGNLFLRSSTRGPSPLRGEFLRGRKMRSRPRACAIRARGSWPMCPWAVSRKERIWSRLEG